MRNRLLYLMLPAAMIFLWSCNNNDSIPVEDLGTASYYPEFWLVDADTTGVETTLVLNFNQDAKSDPSCFAVYRFVWKDSREVSAEEMELSVDDVVQKTNRFRVTSCQDRVKIRIRFLPAAKEGLQEGYLQLVEHNLDMQGEKLLAQGSEENALLWRIKFDKRCNPLRLAVWIVISSLVFLFLLWVFVLRRMFFPTFKALNKTMIIPNQIPVSIRFKGARMVVIDNVKHKQSWWDCLWKGKIIYKQNPAITTQIKLKPTGKGRKALFVANAANYICMPNPIGMQPSKVNDLLNHQQIIIQ